MLPMIVLLPVIQLLVLGHAATQEMKNINIAIVDFDCSPESRRLAGSFDKSSFYTVVPTSQSVVSATNLVHGGIAHAVLVIPSGFSAQLAGGGQTKVQLLVDAINVTTAPLITSYTSSIIGTFAKSISVESGHNLPNADQLSIRHWYNPMLDYQQYMVPGILVILVIVIGMVLTAFNIVREKEMGTIEQIGVTPIRKSQFIAGKLIPFWIIGQIELIFGLIYTHFVFNLHITGSIPLLFLFASVFLIVALSMGLLLSTFASNQQQVMFMVFFFLIVFILMSGIFTPTESMPIVAQIFNRINPIYYFMRVIRMVMLKGSTFLDILPELVSMSVLAVLFSTFAVVKYRKTVN